ncbi:MAG: LacI family DNA-binding transcriptional regulator [Xanthomonadaceae bacterium]|nr:LacI family DNA-binding transcriptional regulator [Xanthomonadaceae bacterium]
MATIKDVAREAKVSVATVSRALNGGHGVTPGTRARIERAASRLHYVPHGAARSLVTRRTQTVGALLPDLFGEFFSELIRGMDLAARTHGLHLLVSSSHNDASEATAALRAMQGRVDGLLIMSPHVDATVMDDHVAGSLPAVLMNALDGHGHPALNIDNFGGAHAMGRHLLACGHRDIVFIDGPHGNFDAAARLAGFRDALAGSDARVHVLPGDFTEEAGYRAGQHIAAMARRPDAVFAANDAMAIGCLFALNGAGLRIPQDIALAGFDDIPISRFVNPALTTVRVHIVELGQQALEQLVRQMESTDRRGGRSVRTLDCEIVVRDSCGMTAKADKRGGS